MQPTQDSFLKSTDTKCVVLRPAKTKGKTQGMFLAGPSSLVPHSSENVISLVLETETDVDLSSYDVKLSSFDVELSSFDVIFDVKLSSFDVVVDVIKGLRSK
jgi:hypothetical protein